MNFMAWRIVVAASLLVFAASFIWTGMTIRLLSRRVATLESGAAMTIPETSKADFRLVDTKIRGMERRIDELENRVVSRVGPSLIDPPARAIREVPFTR